jgi:hypothetical protein
MDSSPESYPRPAPPQKGTIVGFPAVVPLSRDQIQAYADRAWEAADPERWSQPPPSGALPPIVPCDEPEDEEVAQVLPSPLPTPAPVAYPGQAYFYPHHVFPARAVQPVSYEEPPTHIQPLAQHVAVVDDPVVLPMRRRDTGDAMFRHALYVIIPVILLTGVLLRVFL